MEHSSLLMEILLFLSWCLAWPGPEGSEKPAGAQILLALLFLKIPCPLLSLPAAAWAGRAPFSPSLLGVLFTCRCANTSDPEPSCLAGRQVVGAGMEVGSVGFILALPRMIYSTFSWTVTRCRKCSGKNLLRQGSPSEC